MTCLSLLQSSTLAGRRVDVHVKYDLALQPRRHFWPAGLFVDAVLRLMYLTRYKALPSNCRPGISHLEDQVQASGELLSLQVTDTWKAQCVPRDLARMTMVSQLPSKEVFRSRASHECRPVNAFADQSPVSQQCRTRQHLHRYTTRIQQVIPLPAMI